MASKKPKKAAPKKTGGRAQPKPAGKPSEPIQLTWSLDELPSSQHKTGLVGLLLLLRWLLRLPKARRRGVLRVLSLDAGSCTLEVDEEGMEWLFDEAYSAAVIESERDAAFKDTKPLRIVEREEVDPKRIDKKTGKPAVKKVKKFVYPLVVPAGAFLAEVDPEGPQGRWIKLWRDFVWGLLRAVPATRAPYNARSQGKPAVDAAELLETISTRPDRAVELPSTYFVGAQAATAENVSFEDRQRFLFLLHFWPFAVGLAVPAVVDRDGKNSFVGFALSFPDVADLSTFVEEYEKVLRDRLPDVAGYLPKQAILDLPAEAGLSFLHALRQRLKTSESKKRTFDLVLGVDIIHVEREGNNVRTRSTTRIEPEELQQDEYERIRTSFRDGVFRRQLLANLIEGRDWAHGFDRVFATTPSKHFLRGPREAGEWPSQFPSDVKTQLQRFEEHKETSHD